MITLQKFAISSLFSSLNAVKGSAASFTSSPILGLKQWYTNTSAETSILSFEEVIASPLGHSDFNQVSLPQISLI
jgi:hypothetical protein